MAKLVYGPDYGTISVVADSEVVVDGDFEVTAEQALAVSTWQSAQMLKVISESLDEIAAEMPGKK